MGRGTRRMNSLPRVHTVSTEASWKKAINKNNLVFVHFATQFSNSALHSHNSCNNKHVVSFGRMFIVKFQGFERLRQYSATKLHPLRSLHATSSLGRAWIGNAIFG
eukprot:1149375-Prorocentrum_minimum.AAC.2